MDNRDQDALHHSGGEMYKFEIAELSHQDFSQWDALVDRSAHGTVFHKSGWLETCSRSLGKKVKIFGCFQDRQLVGGCSLFLEKKWGLVSVADSRCKMTPYGGFVISSPPGEGVHKQESFYRQIIGDLIHEINKNHFYFISIRNSPGFFDIRPFTSRGWESRVLYTYYIDLGDNLESHADHLVKKNIHKAEKNHISIEPFADISRYYTLLSETYARKNLNPPCSKDLLTDLYAFIQNQNCGEMVVAKTPEDEITCAEIIIQDNHQAYIWSAASASDNFGSPSLLRFEGLKRMQSKGVPKMNMMSGNVPELSQFTAHMNPTLVAYYQIQDSVINHILTGKNED